MDMPVLVCVVLEAVLQKKSQKWLVTSVSLFGLVEELKKIRMFMFKIAELISCAMSVTSMLTDSGLEKSFLCQSQNFQAEPGCHFSVRIFLSSWSQSCVKTQKFRRRQKKKLSLRPDSAHNRTQTSSVK